MTDYPTKDAARTEIWNRLQDEKLAAFPFPPHGRIPNFKGAGEAARRLFDIPVYAKAKRIKVNPDSAQAAVRAEALRRGITVFVPTPRLAGGFLKLDPDNLQPDQIHAASTMSKCRQFADEVPLADLPQMDAIVCGSVAVTGKGYRAGKGAGYSDMEFAILAELGHHPVPVATTVHDIQLVDGLPQTATDQGLTYIVTPTRIVMCTGKPATPQRIAWETLSTDDLDAMPVLKELRDRNQAKGGHSSDG